MRTCLYAFIFLMTATTSFAQDCASNVKDLKSLTKNNGLPFKWIENTTKNPFQLVLKDGQGMISFNLRTKKGLWADAQGSICRSKNDSYTLKIQKILWGQESPMVARLAKSKVISITFPYTNILEAKVSGMVLEFSPLH